eukprot:8244606-Pyramimonas_sp.AAC.1
MTQQGACLITVRQKAMDVEVWNGVAGSNRPGSHVPLRFCVEGADVRSRPARGWRSANYWAKR